LIDYFGIGEYPTDDVKLYEWMDDLYDLIELAMALEEEFSIEIDDGDLERVETVGELFKLVEEAGS
jgi:acyl carrier protein